MIPRRATLGAGRKYGFRARTFVQGISRPDAVRAYAPTRGDGLARLWVAPGAWGPATGGHLQRAPPMARRRPAAGWPPALGGAPGALRHVTGVHLERAAFEAHRHDPSRADADPRGV